LIGSPDSSGTTAVGGLSHPSISRLREKGALESYHLNLLVATENYCSVTQKFKMAIACTNYPIRQSYPSSICTHPNPLELTSEEKQLVWCRVKGDVLMIYSDVVCV
jgi:hypothetical protein